MIKRERRNVMLNKRRISRRMRKMKRKITIMRSKISKTPATTLTAMIIFSALPVISFSSTLVTLFLGGTMVSFLSITG